MRGSICPLCLCEFADREPGQSCPGGCETDGRGVRVMPQAGYLAAVDFGVVEQFWRDAPPAKRELRDRMLERLARLRERQRREFGGAAVLGAGSPAADDRVTLVN